MTLHVFKMPDQLPDQTAWLERHLMGVHLGALVAELAAIHGAVGKVVSLEDALGSDLAKVLSQGLSVLSASQLTTLLTNPDLLLQLQERVFIDGGDYWNDPAKTPAEVTSRVAAQWERIEQLVTSREPESRSAKSDARLVSATAWWRHPALVSLATAAAVLMVVSLTSAPPTKPAAGWGWNNSGVLVSNVSAPAYLNRLASAAEEWSDKRPESREELLDRLGQYRNGCTRLILAKHEPLAEADRVWLRERCLKWAEKIDKHRQELEACPPDDVLKVRSAIDATVADLAQKLRERSAPLAS